MKRVSTKPGLDPVRLTSAASSFTGRYRYVAELGSGATSRVIAIDDEATGMRCAAKVLDADAGARAVWEFEALRRVESRHLVRALELLRVEQGLPTPFATPRGAWFLIEARAPGNASSAALAEQPLEGRAAWLRAVTSGVLQALDALHVAGLSHGDVKPENVLVEGTHATLVDLGFAEPFGRHSTVSGTVHFLAPEAHEGERSAGTDLYALGVTMLAWMHGALTDPIDAPEAPSWVPEDLSTLARALVQSRIADRPYGARDALNRMGLATAPSVTRTIPFVGPRDAIEGLAAALDAHGTAALIGPPGSGRTRLIEEAARATQERIARTGADVPTFVRTSTLPWSLATPALIHLTEPVDPIRLKRFIAATRLRGHRPWVALEAAEAPEGMLAFQSSPLVASDVARMLEAARGETPSTATTQAAMRATLGYPGRIVRMLPLLEASGHDPLRASSWRDATWATREEQPQPQDARDFFAMVSAFGGALALDAPDSNASEGARAALQQGFATRERDGTLVLRDDIATRARPRKNTFASWAKRAVAMGVRGPARAAVAWHLHHKEQALGLLQTFVRAAREAGEPERARETLERFLTIAPEARSQLALALSDACRAEGDFDTAAHVLEEAPDSRERALAQAELMRLEGRLDEAERALENASISATDGEANALRARVALARGDLTGARDRALAACIQSEALATARAHETLSLAALFQGTLAEAEAHAQQGLAASRSIEPIELARAWEGRATSLLGQVQARLGHIAESARLHAESAALASRAGDRLLDATFSFNAGLASLEIGQLGESIALLERAALGLTRLGREAEGSRTIANLANALALVGDEARAGQLVQQLLQDHARKPSRDAAAIDLALIVRADIAMAQGKLRTAAQALETLAHGSTFEAIAWARVAHLHAIQGDLKRARVALASSHPNDARGHAERGLAAARIALDEEHYDEAKRALDALAPTLDFEMRCRALGLTADVHEALRADEPKANALTQLRELIEPALRALSPTQQTLFRQLPHVRRALTEGGVRHAGDSERSLRQALEGAARIAARATWKSTLTELTETALRVAAAERAFVVAWSNGEAHVIARAGAVDEHARPSTSLVLRALRERVVNTSDAIASSDASASVHALSLRSVLAVRLASHVNEHEVRTSYVLALDDRLRPAAFDPHLVDCIRALADICGPVLEARTEARRLRREVRSQAARVESLADENEKQRERMRGLGQGDAFAPFVHASESTKSLVRDARRLAHSNLSVLITGETGTGKSLLARCIHLESERRHAPFVVEEGGAFTSELLESTLFGHVRGAFTGADRSRKGLFELAHGGTLFLDGIDEAPLSVQAKLLRVLVEGLVRPMGSEREKRVDVRIVTTLHHASDERIPSRLREDLFYRLAGATLSVPPLRSRTEDLSAIIHARLATPPESQLSAAAMRALLNHPWPGNVRELEHVLSQAKLLATGGTIDVAHLQLPVIETAQSDLHQLRGALTRELVAEALRRNQQNRTRAARELGISRFGLQKILKRIGSDPDKSDA